LFGHSLLYRSIWELLQIALATYCFLTVKASYMPLKLSTKIASTIHPRWTAVNYSDILPPTTLLFLPSHSWPLIYKTHQYNHWKFYLIILMCRVFGTKFAYSQNKGSAYLSSFFFYLIPDTDSRLPSHLPWSLLLFQLGRSLTLQYDQN